MGWSGGGETTSVAGIQYDPEAQMIDTSADGRVRVYWHPG
jgi:hypothetical protein